ncbi:MAG: NADH-quinone oxidoreductase subunit M [Nitrospinae bacterium]|nr:NADH-quinone oxidoreductase subunit M [Nitrospinota bacterium]
MTDMAIPSGGIPWITLVLFLPLVGVVTILLAKEELAKWIALAFSLVVVAASLPLWAMFDVSTPAMQFVERHSWIASPPINYAVGVDGISLPLVLLTTFLGPLCVLVSWTAIQTRVREFMISLLVMETATLGVFVSLDFVLFYIFWEIMLIPMYLLIGVWGGPNRIYAAIKFFLYTLTGSVLLLVAILVLFFEGGQTFDILALSKAEYDPSLQNWLFWAFFVAFAVKVPMFPFHTWLPDAHVEAPTAGSVVLASVLLKMGAYGFLRLTLPILPDATAAFTPIIMTLSVVAIIYGAYMAFAQADLKKLIAYSSVSHMGFVTLGIFAFNAQGVEGAILQMVNHGITTGALFMCIGIIYERTHSREIVDNSGLAKPMPRFATFLVIFGLSSIGLPGMNSFVGEFLVLIGTFLWSKLAATLAALGVILAAAYILWMLQRVVYGVPSSHMAPKLYDMNWREMSMLLPLVGFVFWIGLYPKPLLDVMHASVNNLVQQEVRVMTVQDQPVKNTEQYVIATPHPSSALLESEAQ